MCGFFFALILWLNLIPGTPMKQSSKQSALTSVSYLLVGFLSLFIAFPIFILIHQQLPEYDWPVHSDRILLFLLVVLFVLLLLSMFRPIINFIFIGSLIILVYGTFTDTYGFQNLATCLLYTSDAADER